MASKNCRILTFKLKKTERYCEQLEQEKIDTSKKIKDMIETGMLSGDKQKMKELETELSIAKEVSLKLHSEIEGLNNERARLESELCDIKSQMQEKRPSLFGFGKKNSPVNTLKLNRPPDGRLSPAASSGHGSLTPQSSFEAKEKEYEEVVRSLYDTMEREKDLQEQLKFSEEESKTMRKKLSSIEQENEILMMQIRKLALKKGKQGMEEKEDEELSTEEMKLHLDLYEQEMGVLRKRSDVLESENESLQSEVKILQEKLTHTPVMPKIEMPELSPNSSPNVIYEYKIRLMEQESRELRKKLVDREKENESLRTEVSIHRRKSSTTKHHHPMIRSHSLEVDTSQHVDTKRHLQLVEQEAGILRQKIQALEMENDKMQKENKKLALRMNMLSASQERLNKIQSASQERLNKLTEFKQPSGNNSSNSSGRASPMPQSKATPNVSKSNNPPSRRSSMN